MTNVNQPQNDFAQTDDEAKQKFEIYKSKDPFPEITPALLNSADIYDYVAVTGMIYPFEPKENLKSASYAVPILGKAVYWDGDNQKHVEIIDKGTEFKLKPNSIAFVTLEPMFRLPDYIAFRFNLKITNVYRGILLGTGPLVDPGFAGKLSIPLHNLTTNEYTFIGGVDLIWMEFTKLSPNQRWDKNIYENIPRTGKYVKFPSNKALPDVEGYLRKADPHRSIRSSIPEVFQNAEKAAKEATDKVTFFQKVLTIGGGISAIVIFMSLLALYFQVTSLVQDSVNFVKSAKKELEQSSSINTIEQENQKLIRENQKLIQENKEIKQEIEKIKKK